MMRLSRFLPLFGAILSLFVISESVFAEGKSGDAKSRHYGKGQPKTVQGLPKGQLRKQIEGLPSKAQGKALGWLQRIEFPVEDINSIRVNEHGDVSYADYHVPANAEASPGESTTNSTESEVTEQQAFNLHSRPGSNNVLYLDFNGHTVPPSAWRSYTLEALPFDPSGNDSPATEASFTQVELSRIHEIWHRIAEDYVPFDIDVTTEEPAVFTNTTGHLLFTHDYDADGLSMPSAGAGGTAFIDVFGADNYAQYSPAFVYYTNLTSADHGLANYTADAAAHEFGHNLGLTHDGLTGVSSYYEGHGDGLVSWAPIMGKLYYKNVTQWSKGEYEGATNPQDDLSVIAGKLGYAADDHADSTSQATLLVVEDNGDILVSSPEVDPYNALDQNKGVIEDSADSDWFYIDVSGSGNLSLTATPAWHSFTRVDKRGSNLDIELMVVDSDLDIVGSSEPDYDTEAELTVPVSSGKYYVIIDGVGNNTLSDYSDYASLGMYFLEGHIDTSVTQPDIDNKAPTPGVMSWQSPPAAEGYSSITMTSVEATDESGMVEYYFSCVAGGTGCVDSVWQSSASHTAEGLASGSYYAFKVKARDIHGNVNTASATQGTTTHAPPANKPPVAVVSYSPDPAIITKANTVSVTLDGSASTDEDGQIVSWLWKDTTDAELGTTASVTTKLREGTHRITLTVTDDDGDSSHTTVDVVVSKGSSDDDGSKGKKPPPKK